ncbi:MAG: LamG domain-containing protein [Cyclobacteriaceae bacterium]
MNIKALGIFLTLFVCLLSCEEENYPIENRAIQFDGVNDYIELGNIYDNLSLPVTMSAWIWLDPTSDAGSIPILDTQDGLPIYNGVGFLTSNTASLAAQFGDGLGENNSAFRRAKSATFAPISGRWVNFAIVIRDASDMSLYYNGIDVGGNYSGTSNNPMNSNSPTETAKIGLLNQNGSVFRFKGKMDELKIWNKSLNQDEIQKVIFTKQTSTYPGLIGYWDFDEPTGNQVLDKSSNQFHGVLMGTPTRVVSSAPID